MPLLGWYLFNVTGAPCAGSSGSSSSLSSSCSTNRASSTQPAAVQVAPEGAEAGVTSTSASSGVAVSGSSASIVSASSGSVVGSSSGMSSGGGSAAAQQPQPGPQPASDTSAAHAAVAPAGQVSAAAPSAVSTSLVRTGSVGRRSLDLIQQRSSLAAACNNATAGTGVVPAVGAGSDASCSSCISSMSCAVSLAAPSFSSDAVTGCCNIRCGNSSSDACCTSTSGDYASCSCNDCGCLDVIDDAPSRSIGAVGSSSMSALNKTDATKAGGSAAMDASDTCCKDQQ
ncbi:hypothetical protein COO60DRAFT_1477326 [Scenedesmus sp. NREL 46B-D3]|nr:hypothetical protein COO60DRAFT_1477326 [Scenedesmus sp. NREL 46B-D3]